MTQMIQISREKLEDWAKDLDYALTEDVLSDIKTILKETPAVATKQQLDEVTFENLQIGETVYLINGKHTKVDLVNQPFEVKEKKRKNVVITLVNHVGKYPPGARFNVAPDLLERRS